VCEYTVGRECRPSLIFSEADIEVVFRVTMCVTKIKLKYALIVPIDSLCGLVVRVLGYRSGDPGSIPGTTKKKENSSGSGTGSTRPREYN
jgi:hypothetical protein